MRRKAKSRVFAVTEFQKRGSRILVEVQRFRCDAETGRDRGPIRGIARYGLRQYCLRQCRERPAEMENAPPRCLTSTGRMEEVLGGSYGTAGNDQRGSGTSLFRARSCGATGNGSDVGHNPRECRTGPTSFSLAGPRIGQRRGG